MRLIDADALEKEFCHGCQYEHNKYANCIDCAVANAPTVDAVPVVHGYWETIFSVDCVTYKYKCSNCGHYVRIGSDRNFCPNCGARMDGERKEDGDC